MGVKKYLVPRASPRSTNVNPSLKRAVGLTLSFEGDQPTNIMAQTLRYEMRKPLVCRRVWTTNCLSSFSPIAATHSGLSPAEVTLCDVTKHFLVMLRNLLTPLHPTFQSSKYKFLLIIADPITPSCRSLRQHYPRILKTTLRLRIGIVHKSYLPFYMVN